VSFTPWPWGAIGASDTVSECDSANGGIKIVVEVGQYEGVLISAIIFWTVVSAGWTVALRSVWVSLLPGVFVSPIMGERSRRSVRPRRRRTA